MKPEKMYHVEAAPYHQRGLFKDGVYLIPVLAGLVVEGMVESK